MHTKTKKISFKECVVYNFGYESLLQRSGENHSKT